MALSIKIVCITLLCVNLNAMPTENPLNPFVPDPSILKIIGWKAEISVCGLDFIKLMTTVCSVCNDGQCAVEKSSNKTQNEILQIASQCCFEYCKVESMKMFCGYQSFLADYIMAELATTQQVDTITTKINAPTSGNLLSFMSKFILNPFLF